MNVEKSALFESILKEGTQIEVLGDIVREGAAVEVRWGSASVRAEGEPGEIAALEIFLRRLNGAPSWQDAGEGLPLSPEDLSTLLCDLLRVGAAVDLDAVWRFFHTASANPKVRGTYNDPQLAYGLPRHKPQGKIARPTPPPLDAMTIRLAQTRLSSYGDRIASRTRSLEMAFCLASDTYRPVGGRRPIASAGALYPLQFFVIGGHTGGDLGIYAVDHDSNHILEIGGTTPDLVAACFIPDDELLRALHGGAAVIVIAADPERTIYKYSERGWRYCLMECGAAMHHIALAASELRVSQRPIGGFYDGPLAALLQHEVHPLLSIILAAAEDAHDG